MFSDFPSLHPLIVHFPIVLILLAAGFQASLVWKHRQQIRWATLVIMTLAFFSSLAASTVFHAMISADAPKEIQDIFASHEEFAKYTLWMSGFTLALKCIGDFYKLYRRSYDVLVLTAAVLTAILLSITGHHGGRLVHVAGVGPMGRYLMEDHHGAGKDDMENMEKNHGDSIHGKNMKDMKGMDDMKDMKKEGMKDMKGMDNMKDRKKEGMKDMDNMKDMNKDDMKNMNMPGMNMKTPMDTFRFEDNNPARKKSKTKAQK